MKVSLLVMSQGKSEGKSIPITLSQFVIGRDPQCHLRPASAAISKRHCALLVRGDKAFVRDFESTNGTFVNEVQVKGERELLDGDALKVGPLQFKVRIEKAVVAPSKPTPPPVTKAVEESDDESVAAMLLSLQDDGTPAGSGGEVDSQGVPTGSTVMNIAATTDTTEENKAGDEKKAPPAKPATGNTSTAAKAILEKYMRRPRS
jgi:pSer/pThr/pTyr-binding forkhead associated (FHA) protein